MKNNSSCLTHQLHFTVIASLACLLQALVAVGAEAIPGSLPVHPRLLFGAKEVSEIKQRIANNAQDKSRFDRLKSQADAWLGKKITLPERGGQWFHYYSCPKHGARLRTESPTRHVCPVDQEVLTGYPYDDVVLMSDHNGLASGLRTLGMVYQLSGDPRYAAQGKEILLAYARKYPSYPLHNIRGEARVGGGKVGPQTLDESTWLITMVEGADCLWDTLAKSEQEEVASGLLIPATDVIRQHKMGIHNIQCWKNSAVGLTGLLLGDRKLIDEALNSESGFFQQVAKGISADGAWYEGAWGYHFYTVSAITRLTEGALHSGIQLYGPEFKKMFDAPLAMAMPDLTLPAFNDSHAVSVVGSAGLYEIAYARYKDERYRAVLGRSRRDSHTSLLAGTPEIKAPPPFTPMATNYPASGYAILTSGVGKDAAWLSLDYGPHGGGHGHPDKLGFVMYGLGRVQAPDPGTANYGVPIQGGWFRTTIAHNTLTVDETSQKAAEGKCEAFVSRDGFCAVTANAGRIYEGVNFRRTVALVGTNLFLFIDQIEGAREHQFDLAYHNVGQLVAPAKSETAEVAKKPGYSYLRNLKTLSTSEGLQLDFSLGGQQVHWAMAGGAPTTFLTGTGVGAHTEDRVPIVIARRKAETAVFLWCISLDPKAEELVVLPEPVKCLDVAKPAMTEVAAMRVKSPSGTHILVANPLGRKLQVGTQEVEDKIIYLH